MSGGQVRVEPGQLLLAAHPGDTVMAAARRAGYRWPTVCGGRATCTTCYVLVRRGADRLTAPEPRERDALAALLRRHADEAPGCVRLACQAVVEGDVTVYKRGVRPMTTTALAHWPADATEEVLDVTVGQALRDAVAECPERIALIEAGGEQRRYTYADLLDEAEAVAGGLLGRFIPGERVALWLANVPEWVVLEFAAALAGLTIVTVNPTLRPAELSFILRQSRAAGIVLGEGYRGASHRAFLTSVRPDAPELRQVVYLSEWKELARARLATLPTVDPASPLMIQYTSGTTGTPKGAVLHHRSLLNNARLAARGFGLSDPSVWINALPMFHTGGSVMNTLGALTMRGTQVLLPEFDPGGALAAIEEEGGTVMVAVPTMLSAMLDHPSLAGRDLSRFERVISGGTTVPPELVRRVEAGFGVDYGVVFGQTETGGVITQSPPEASAEDKAHTVGRPIGHTEVRISDPADGGTVAPGVVGEIRVRGIGIMAEYFDRPDESAATIDGQGWLRTGDLGLMDDRGALRITGRLKDMVIRGGENIYPREIEDCAFSHPRVAEVAVVGVPDDHWGEDLVGFVRWRDDAAEVDDLRAFLKERLAPHKVP
ncbi:MAG TPA: AMP-binding protein, partial [Acidimicrobiia bacterium]|nr:AMP-binding protein [Acidimicrobiia bacterium]